MMLILSLFSIVQKLSYISPHKHCCSQQLNRARVRKLIKYSSVYFYFLLIEVARTVHVQILLYSLQHHLRVMRASFIGVLSHLCAITTVVSNLK